MADHLFRENSGKMIAVLSRSFGLHNIDQISDIVQDTFEAALKHWKFEGIPENPAGWLMQVAKFQAINFFKRESKTTRVSPSSFIKNFDLSTEENTGDYFLQTDVEDSQLRLLLTCCHPDFSEKNQIILTLNIICGFGTPEIAGALLMNEEAVKKALARTKQELKKKKNILETPSLLKFEKRISTVQTIIYLIFNEGYKTTRGKQIINNDLCYEAIRLGKLVLNPAVSLLAENNALLALMFFNLARFPARVNSSGDMISLEDQDRSKWNKVFIEEGNAYLNFATKGDKLSRFHLEAIISSLHCLAPSFEKTDWKSIYFLYEQLENIEPSSLVTLNKIIAKSYISKIESCLEEISALKEKSLLSIPYMIFAAEASLYKRNGDLKKAQESYLKASDHASSPFDKQFLKTKISQC